MLLKLLIRSFGITVFRVIHFFIQVHARKEYLVYDLLDDSSHLMKWASAKLKFDLKEHNTRLCLSVLESIPPQWKRKVKSHNIKITDDVSAGPPLKMTVKSAYNILLRSVKIFPTSQRSVKNLLNNHSIN